MKNLIVVGAGAIGALAVSTLLGGAVAAADDYAGQSYSDASSAASDAGKTVVIASRVGDKKDEGDCLVTRSQNAPFASANDGAHVADTVQFYLNCNGGYATATSPGPSLASPEGATAKAADDEKAAEAQAQAVQSEEAELADLGQTPGEPGANG